MASSESQNRMARAQWIGAGALVLLGAVFLWRSFVALPLGTLSDPGPGAAPVLLAGLLIVCALWNQLGGGAALLDADEEEEAPAEPGALRHAILLFAAVIAAAFALGPLGYRLTILALLLLLVGLVERKPLTTTLLLSLGLSFGSYWLFNNLLKVPLPTGPFGL
jgi:hypothetical protein